MSYYLVHNNYLLQSFRLSFQSLNTGFVHYSFNPKRHGLFGQLNTWGGGRILPILEKRSVTPPNFILEQQTESHMKAEDFS